MVGFSNFFDASLIWWHGRSTLVSRSDASKAVLRVGKHPYLNCIERGSRSTISFLEKIKLNLSLTDTHPSRRTELIHLVLSIRRAEKPPPSCRSCTRGARHESAPQPHVELLPPPGSHLIRPRRSWDELPASTAPA